MITTDPRDYGTVCDVLTRVLNEGSIWRSNLERGYVPRFVLEYVVGSVRECLWNTLLTDESQGRTWMNVGCSRILSFHADMMTPVLNPPLATYLLEITRSDEAWMRAETIRREDDAFKTDMLLMSPSTLNELANSDTSRPDTRSFAGCILTYLMPLRESWKKAFISAQETETAWEPEPYPRVDNISCRDEVLTRGTDLCADDSCYIRDLGRRFRPPSDTISMIQRTLLRGAIGCFAQDEAYELAYGWTKGRQVTKALDSFGGFSSSGSDWLQLLDSEDHELVAPVYRALTEILKNHVHRKNNWQHPTYVATERMTRELLALRKKLVASSRAVSSDFMAHWCTTVLMPNINSLQTDSDHIYQVVDPVMRCAVVAVTESGSDTDAPDSFAAAATESWAALLERLRRLSRQMEGIRKLAPSKRRVYEREQMDAQAQTEAWFRGEYQICGETSRSHIQAAYEAYLGARLVFRS